MFLQCHKKSAFCSNINFCKCLNIYVCTGLWRFYCVHFFIMSSNDRHIPRGILIFVFSPTATLPHTDCMLDGNTSFRQRFPGLLSLATFDSEALSLATFESAACFRMFPAHGSCCRQTFAARAGYVRRSIASSFHGVAECSENTNTKQN